MLVFRRLVSLFALLTSKTLLQILEAKPQLANHTAFTTGFNCLHYAAGEFMQQAYARVKHCSFSLCCGVLLLDP